MFSGGIKRDQWHEIGQYNHHNVTVNNIVRIAMLQIKSNQFQFNP